MIYFPIIQFLIYKIQMKFQKLEFVVRLHLILICQRYTV